MHYPTLVLKCNSLPKLEGLLSYGPYIYDVFKNQIKFIMENLNSNKQPSVSISGSYSFGWQQMKKHFLYFFLVAVIVVVANIPMSSLKDQDFGHSPQLVLLQIIIAAYGMLVLSIIEYGADWINLRLVRDEKIKIEDMFVGFKTNYLNIVLANLLTFAIVGMGIIFLIVPGIILACRLAFVPYLVMDKQLQPVAAIEKSWEMTRGHGWKIFGMGILAIFIFILGLICLLVGAFFAAMWISAAFASLYHAIDMQEAYSLDDDNHNDISEIPV